jgi:Secretion system C-terminal sorting domain
MKNFYMFIVLFAMGSTGLADDNLFNKKHRITKEIPNKTPVKNNNKFLKNTSDTVPTIEKESYWDNFAQTWNPVGSLKHVYANGLLVADYELSYSHSDTSGRTLYSYDAENKLTQKLKQDWLAPGVYSNVQRENFSYYNTYLGQIVTLEYWDLGLNDWQYIYRYRTEYNDKGFETKNVRENWENGNWKINYGYSRAITYLNPNSSKILETVDSSYFAQTNKFEINNKFSRTYNADMQIETENYYSVNQLTDTLKLSGVDSVFYQNKELNLFVSYTVNNNSFVKDYKVDSIIWFNYDPSLEYFENKYLQAIESSWNGNAWEKSLRAKINYPDNYGSSIVTTERFMNEWLKAYRYNDLYDSRLNKIEESSESFDLSSNSWTYNYGSRVNPTYDAANNLSELIFSGVNPNLNVWENEAKVEYLNYIVITTGIHSNKNTLQTTLYPNPTNNGNVSINVSIESKSELRIKIMDLKGSIIYIDKKDLGKGINTIELTGLKQGLYLMELSTDDGLAKTKLIVN